MNQHDQTCSFFTSGRACDCGAPQQEASGEEPPLLGRWHHGEGILVSGTIRIARWDCDTNPPQSFRDNVLEWMCGVLNAAVRQWEKHAPDPFAEDRAAATAPAGGVTDDSTPGQWFVRKRIVDGELRDCFVAAPDFLGLAYDAEILGDDEYRDGKNGDKDDGSGLRRKLADCELIVKAVTQYRAAATEPAADVNVWLPGWSHVQSATAPAGGVTALRIAVDALEILNRRPRPMCRDCADENGTCPSSGLPCDMAAVIRDARAALTTAARAAEPKPAPGMAVQALAGEIIAALLADEKDGGYDLTGGLFGPAFSKLVRRWAAAEIAASPTPPTGTSKGEGK